MDLNEHGDPNLEMVKDMVVLLLGNGVVVDKIKIIILLEEPSIEDELDRLSHYNFSIEYHFI